MPALNYDLHKLGWRAFQDLCGVVLQQSLGQTFTTFADSNDAGQDGAFQGSWLSPVDAPDPELAEFTRRGISVVAQCKFSSSPSGTLTPSSLTDELDKIEALHTAGQCDGYLLLTNLRVTGRTKLWLVEEVRKRGPQHVAVLPGEWICTQIEQDWNLRRYVPRVYGLGDLGRILDDRRIRQARALLTGLTRELETFVPTDAYRRASDALAVHGFVMLLGEPACGKSSIAATLCVTALDQGSSSVKRVDGPDELVAHWDPDDPGQLFWVDDAFGSIRHEPSLTDAWARRMDQVMAAVGDGARVVLTSRDYIYREARSRLKEYAYPRLREQQVAVDVTKLSEVEKQKILYSHLKAGDQDAVTLERWRPAFRSVIRLDRFIPEVARRVSLKAFLPPEGLPRVADLVDFFEHPRRFLVDVMDGLDPEQRAALAVVYLAGDELAAPVTLTPRLEEAVLRLGATPHDTLRAFDALQDTFLTLGEDTTGSPVWRFHHPTIREGFAASVAESLSTLSVCIDGMTDFELVRQLDCGGPSSRGTIVTVPPSLYDRVIDRVGVPGRQQGEWGIPIAAWFLLRQCSDEFLTAWARRNQSELGELVRFGAYMDAFWEPQLLGRLAGTGALPEDVRELAVERVRRMALDFDPGWAEKEVVRLFRPSELAELLDDLRRDVVSDFHGAIDTSGDGYESGTAPEERFESARKAVDAIRRALPGDVEVLDACHEADEYIDEEIRSAENGWRGSSGRGSSASSGSGSPSVVAPISDGGRDPFDDVADGH
jgi:hypothetical protein